MSLDPDNSIDDPACSSNSSSYTTRPSSYVRSLLEKKRSELIDQLNNMNTYSENSQEKSPSMKDFLELKIDQINRLISFMDNKNNENFLTNL